VTRIPADNLIVATGSGKTYTEEDLRKDGRGKEETDERNGEDVQTVRVWGDTAAVTARFWEKGKQRPGSPLTASSGERHTRAHACRMETRVWANLLAAVKSRQVRWSG
jgi:hypothetical protein